MSRHTGFEHSLETIRKIRHSVVKNKSIIWYLRKDNQFEIIDNLTLWASKNSMSKGTLCNTAKYKTRKYKGWKIQKFDLTKISEETADVLKKAITKFSSYLIEKYNRFRPKQTIQKLYKNYIEKQEKEQNYEKYQIVGDIDGNPIIGFLNEFGDPFEAGKQELLEFQENRPDLFSTLQLRLEKILKQMHPLTV